MRFDVFHAILEAPKYYHFGWSFGNKFQNVLMLWGYIPWADEKNALGLRSCCLDVHRLLRLSKFGRVLWSYNPLMLASLPRLLSRYLMKPVSKYVG